MNRSLSPRGVIVPLVTPFDAAGELDVATLRRLVGFVLDAGVHGLFPGGTTGEGPLLSVAERRQITETVIGETRGRVPVIVQVGSITTGETIAMAQHAAEAGADGVAVLTPYYYRVDDTAMLAYYAAVCGAIPEMPVYVYNIPGRTGNDLTPPLVAAIAAQSPNVVGIKESSGNLGAAIDILAQTPRLQVIQGSDGLILPALAMGAQASVSGNANVFPELFVALWDAYWAGDLAAARAAQERINTVRRILKDGADLSLFKAVLARRGLPVGGVRAPLRGAEPETIAAAIAALEAAGIDLTPAAQLVSR